MNLYSKVYHFLKLLDIKITEKSHNNHTVCIDISKMSKMNCKIIHGKFCVELFNFVEIHAIIVE